MTDRSALIERLDVMGGMLAMGERIAFGSDAVLLAEAAAALRDLTEWRDIATAPKGTDSLTPMLVVDADGFSSYHVAYEAWTDDDGSPAWFNGDTRVHATHWLPLPSAPNQAKEAGE